MFFLHSGVWDENIEALCTLVGSYEAELIPVQIRESDFHGFKHTEQFPLLVYFRLLVCRCLPQTEDRALWLDVDLIVNGSLQSGLLAQAGEDHSLHWQGKTLAPAVFSPGSCFVGSLLLKNLQKRPAVRHRLPDGAKLPPGADCCFYSSSACPV